MRYQAWWQKQVMEDKRTIGVHNMGSFEFYSPSPEKAKRSAKRQARKMIRLEKLAAPQNRRILARVTALVDEQGKVHHVNWPLRQGIYSSQPLKG